MESSIKKSTFSFYLSIISFVGFLPTGQATDLNEVLSDAVTIVQSGASEISDSIQEDIRQIQYDVPSTVQTVRDHLPDNLPPRNKHIVISWLPNSIALSTIRFKHYGSEFNPEKILASEYGFVLASGLSITKVDKPARYWTWGVGISPSLSYFSFDQRDLDAKLLFARANASFKWHFHKLVGSLKVKAGVGPMLLKGKVQRVDQKLTLVPALGLGVAWYRFVARKVFLQLKFSHFRLMNKLFSSRPTVGLENLDSINSVSFRIGYMVF